MDTSAASQVERSTGTRSGPVIDHWSLSQSRFALEDRPVPSPRSNAARAQDFWTGATLSQISYGGSKRWRQG